MPEARRHTWSPVIILTWMPISRHFSMVSLVSWRGGSNRGTRPAGGTCKEIQVQHKRLCGMFHIDGTLPSFCEKAGSK